MAALGILKQDHEALFNAIHAQGLELDSLDKLARWFDSHGTSADAFRSMFNSAAIDQQVELADDMQRRLKIASVPSIVINGKYLVETTQEVGPTRMLDVMDYLLKKETALDSPDKPARSATSAPPPSG